MALQVSLSASIRSLPGDKGFPPSTSAPQEAFDLEQFAGYDIPLMPLVIKTLFVNNVTGEGVANIRKTLYKVNLYLYKNRVVNFEDPQRNRVLS